ncbi:hypothetical protein ALNOE001_03240 [Candidatus Methanobinarius endosymbioticus]|uniref:Uncharacterized protein n=1 Tax=Candidatus Methanobinarius endosymbioticus TaxID=2006182 RepID=A0A366MFI4_9EURY|nr:hypothetical protein ALNOE001_03240 [Candidatus Methanobinarius endosymbioticus]
MMINTNKYEFKNIEFRLPDNLEFLPSSNIPFFLKKMNLNLNIISFIKDETKEGKYFHTAIFNNTDDLLDDFDQYLKTI